MMSTEEHPNIDDLIELPAPGDPQISPGGEWIAYTLRKPDWKENEHTNQIWLAPTSGDNPRQMTFAKNSSYSPRWSPDGGWLAFLSKRKEDEHPQIYRMSSSGGEAERMSESETDVRQ